MEDRFQQYRQLNYASFRELAQQEGLSPHQKIGFPDEYRAGYTEMILTDLRSKLPALDQNLSRVVDIGPGCGELGARIVEWARQQQHTLWLIDAPEVLAALPGSEGCQQLPGCFPDEVQSGLQPLLGQCDAVICYSVFHYVFTEGNLYRFLDVALSLLAPGGRLLLGDLPNDSMLRRFLASDAGRQYHRHYTGRDEDPVLAFNCASPGKLDDAVLIGLLLRARQSGFHAYLVPQSSALPMANRREDLLFIRP